METLIVKKKIYQVVESLGERTFLVELDSKKFVIKTFEPKSASFKNFLFAAKRLSNANIRIPNPIKSDKKQGTVLLPYIEGKTAFEELLEHDLEEKVIEDLFIQNWNARSHKLRLDFNPQSFKIVNNELVYMTYLFRDYKREEDFTNNEVWLWFYTKKFVDLLIKQGIKIEKTRLLPENERNKQVVLQVVKYFR